MICESFDSHSPFKAPHCAFCTFRCDILFGLWSFILSSLIPLIGVFPLFIYLEDTI